MAEGPDRGRAWVVAVAVMLVYLICAGTFRASGLLFVGFLNTYKVDRKMAAMPFSLRSSVRSLLAPVVGVLGAKYSIPAITIAGGILGVVSSALCYFATDIVWITVIWGGLNGLAMSLLNVLPPVVIGQYFNKYRTTASGLSFSGSCMGAFIFPVIIETLLVNYGLNGTFLIMAGIFMHTIPACMLFTRPRWSTGLKEDRLQDKRGSSTTKTESKTEQNAVNGVARNNHDIHSKVTFHVGDEPEPKLYLPSSKSMNSLYPIYEMTSGNQHDVPTVSSLSLNNRLIKSSTENFFDIDLDYLKQMSDLVYQMLSMELPNVEMSYRAILLEVDKDDLWHPEKNEIVQEIENMYQQLEKSLDIDIVSESTIRANGLYMKRTMVHGPLTASKRTQSLQAVRRYFRTHKARALQRGKNRSAPNISNIYNELVRKDYILSKLRVLCNSNEIRIISHLSQYNPRDVLKVLFQVRCLYTLYQDLESTDQEACILMDSASDTYSSQVEILAEPIELDESCKLDINASDNSLTHHIRKALRLFKNPLFLLICFTRTAFYVNFNPLINTIVDYGVDRGLEETDGKYTIIALSAGDMVGRIGFGWITDSGFVTLSRFTLVVLVLLGLSSISLPLLHSKWALFSSISLFGLFYGTGYIRSPVLVAKYLKADEQSIAMGCIEFFSGIWGFLFPFYIGYFRDEVGTYNPIYFINGSLAILAGLSWLLEPYFMKNLS